MIQEMTSKEFKHYYLKWSKAVAFFIPSMLFALVLCDHLLGFDFSKNMYVIAFISCSVMMAFLATSWISALNLESRFLNCKVERVIDQFDEDITLSDIADCIKKEGYAPDIKEDDNSVMFRIQGELYRVHYQDSRFSLYKYYHVGESTDIELLKKAIVPTEDHVFGLKVFVTSHEAESASIIFQFSSLFKSVKELQLHFPRCLSILHHGIVFHRERYAELEGDGELVGMEAVTENQVEHKVFS